MNRGATGPGWPPPQAAKALAAFSLADPYLIGVSGGRDSVALLHMMKAAGFQKLVVCHLDHRLRGRESSADARFVERLARALGVPCRVEKIAVRQLATARATSLETAAREARYEFFARAAKIEKCGAVFLAHHADDQVETFLFNLFRGGGTLGLCGMKSESEWRGGAATLRLVRPLLGVWRAEIDAYLRAHQVKFREDRSNGERVHTRGKMRHEIIPAIERALGREVRKPIWKAAEILRAQQEYLDHSLGFFAPELSVSDVRSLSEAPQRLLIHRWLQSHGVPELTFDLVQSVRTLLEVPARCAKINLPGDRHVRRRAQKLFVE